MELLYHAACFSLDNAYEMAAAKEMKKRRTNALLIDFHNVAREIIKQR
jgi:hypothetical protein